jgi:hypothetical protein
MGMRAALVTILCAAGISTAAAQTAQDNARFAALLATGYAWASLCDRKVDLDAATRYLEAKFGAGARFSSAQLAETMLFVVGSIGLQRSVAGADRAACGSAIKAFGPAGSEVPGLLE